MRASVDGLGAEQRRTRLETAEPIAPEGAGESTATIQIGGNVPDASPKTDTSDRQLNPVDAAAVDALPAGHALLVVQRGPSAGSEPEVKTMMAAQVALRPVLYLDFHSYGRDVLFPYSTCTTRISPSYTDVLPSLALNLKLTDAQNLRLSVSQTLARPEYRELADVQRKLADRLEARDCSLLREAGGVQ